jgi:hypothetical protein
MIVTSEQTIMRIVRGVRVVVVCAAGSILAACSGDKSTSPSTQSVSLTQALSEMSRPELGTLSGMATGVAVPGFPALMPSDCAYQPSTQSFACATVTVSGLTIVRSYALLALGGATQSQYDPASTDGVRTSTHAKGTITGPVSTFTIDDQRDLILTGLLSTTHVLNGSSVTHVDGAITANSSTSIPISSTITTTIANLTLSPGTKYPTSGTITTDITDQAASFSHNTTHMVATFNGSSTLSVTISSGSGTLRCSIDLSGVTKSSCS